MRRDPLRRSAKAKAPGDPTRQIQRNLYRAAKQHPRRKFRRLYQTMCRRDILERAYNEVRANRGAAGVDGVTFETIEQGEGRFAFLDGLQADLATGNYHPIAVRRVFIPKPQGGQRPLGIPSIRDRVVATAAKLVLEPIFEADFQDCSYGFRPRRNAIMALEVIRKSANAGKWFVVDADVQAFFDNVDHWKLLVLFDQRVNDPQMRKTIKGFLTAGVLEGSTLSQPDEGTPQGGPASPLLANIYLNFLDRIWQRKGRALGEMVRYADDLVILCRTREAAEQALELLKATLARLDLDIHPDKTRIVDLRDGSEGFDFLGFHQRRMPSWRRPGKAYLQRWPSKRAQNSIRQKIRDATAPRALLSLSLEEMVARIAPTIRGWGAYFRWGNSARVFAAIDEYAVWRLVLFLRKKHHWPRNRWRKDAKGGGAMALLSHVRPPRLSGTIRRGEPATAAR
jgi:RNA-directed DNA polymerase